MAPGRLLPQSSFYDFLLRVSPSVGLEYQLSPKFTLSGEVEADTTLPRHQLFHGNSRRSLVPTAGTGLMLRYYYYDYYYQAGRARRRRARGPFVGNYLALGTNTELEERAIGEFDYIDINNPPTFKTHYLFDTSVNLYWGMQRQLGHHFLYDLNVGAGAGTRYFPGLNRPEWLYIQPNIDVNLRICFVRGASGGGLSELEHPNAKKAARMGRLFCDLASRNY